MVAKSPTVQIHIFEVAGLGKGPFQVMGCVSLPSPSLGERLELSLHDVVRIAAIEDAHMQCDLRSGDE